MKEKKKGSKNNIQFDPNKSRPDEKDSLDSRKNEEQDFKADDITHNKKENHSNKSSTPGTETYGKRHE